jgi:hypothetical protein
MMILKDGGNMTTHNCGDELIPARITVRKRRGNFLFLFDVMGERCAVCSEEYISRDVAYALDQAVFEFVDEGGGLVISTQTPQVVLETAEASTEEAIRHTMQHGATPALLPC